MDFINISLVDLTRSYSRIDHANMKLNKLLKISTTSCDLESFCQIETRDPTKWRY
jgi:hypothetical protein